MTHCEKVLDLLKDGEWHTSIELHDRVGWRFGARIYDLKKKGYEFKKDKHPKLANIEIWKLVNNPTEIKYTPEAINSKLKMTLF